MSEIRTERTHGMRERLDAAERAALLQIRAMPGYQVLLDMMERACIEQETRLINVDAKDRLGIIAEWRMSKAFWQVFSAMQRKVEEEINIHLNLEQEAAEKREAAENYSLDDRLERP